jgi:hypothetical protein
MKAEAFPKRHPEKEKEPEWSQDESCQKAIEYHTKHLI